MIKWSNRFQVPIQSTVIGELDYTCVQIRKLSDFGSEFVNSKGFASIKP